LSRKWNICQARESGSHRSPDGESWADDSGRVYLPFDANASRSSALTNRPSLNRRDSRGILRESPREFFGRERRRHDRFPEGNSGMTRRRAARVAVECASRAITRACQARRGGVSPSLGSPRQSRVIRKPRRSARRNNAAAQCAMRSRLPSIMDAFNLFLAAT